ncbi:MAG: hypothetical protein R6V43_05575 [Halopseudomonas sp.]
MVTHYKTAGHLACGSEGSHLESTNKVSRVKCRNCRRTEAFQEALRRSRNAKRRAARKAKASVPAQPTYDWRGFWADKLAAMPGTQRLPRGFAEQAYV